MHSITILAAALAALIHLWIFAMESIWFMRPSTYRRFGLASEEQARIVRSWAYNQGFYNLFLALGVAVALALLATGDFAGSRAILLFACGSMIAAGIVLYLHNRTFVRPALIQSVPPLIAIVPLLVFG